MDLIINPSLVIPSRELKWRFSRSAGVGGQNVNKVESRVELVFDLENSKILSLSQKRQLKEHLCSRLVNDCLIIVASEHRTQYLNRQLALRKLSAVLKTSLISFKRVRTPTKPTKSSQKRRVSEKKIRGQIKRRRKNIISLDE